MTSIDNSEVTDQVIQHCSDDSFFILEVFGGDALENRGLGHLAEIKQSVTVLQHTTAL